MLSPEQASRVGDAVIGYGDPVCAGYPLIVDVGTVANRYADDLVDGHAIAVAPGVYTPYNPNVPTC